MSKKDKLFLIFFGILIFLSFGIAGNIELDLPISKGSIVLFILTPKNQTKSFNVLIVQQYFTFWGKKSVDFTARMWYYYNE